jgi:hypothetical protein
VAPFLLTRWLYSYPQENNPAQTLGRVSFTPDKLKTINSELYSNTYIRVGGGILNLPCRTGVGQRTKF